MQCTALERRIEQLETSQRRWRATFLAGLAVWGLACARAEAQTGPQECRASRFVLTDSSGAERGLLEMDGRQPVLRLLGSNRVVQVQLGVVEAPDGAASLYLQNARQNSFVALAATGKAGTSGLEMGGDRKRVRLNSNLPGDAPAMTFSNEDGQITCEVPHRQAQNMPSLKDLVPTVSGSKQ